MSTIRFAIRSLLHYWKLNLTIILGVALSTAILLGAFIIGDTVSFSLEQLTLQRLGRTNWVITGGERLFRKELATELAFENTQTTPVLFANGMAVLDGGRARANQLQVWGVASGFDYFAGTDSLYKLSDDEAVINQQLADVLGVHVGEELLLRVNKLSTFPANTPFVSADESTVSFRVTVKAIATTNETGNFNLQNIQSSPKNIFISIDLLNRQMQLSDKANIVITDWEGSSPDELFELISKHWQLSDLNLEIRENGALNYTELISDRVFIEPAVARKALTEPGSYPVFTYFVNQIKGQEKQTPYSFVAGLPDEKVLLADEEIIITNWLADDLGARMGDSLQVDYFEVGPLRQLVEKTAWFQVTKIVEMNGDWADSNLMPDIPGMSDAGHCSDWETGVPVDLSKIRQKDEAYWNEFKGTPKAFVSLQTAERLWGNRFGSATAIREDRLQAADFEKHLLEGLVPSDVGFQATDARSEGLQAAGQGVDFGELFIGLSFFVLFAALLLAYLMFLLYLNFRRAEIGTLHAMGFPPRKIKCLFFAESIFLVTAGIMLGVPLALAYNSLVLDAINTIWRDIVRTSILHVHITAAALGKAIAIVAGISLFSVWLVLRKFAHQQIVSVQRQHEQEAKPGSWSFFTGTALVLLSILLLLIEGIGREINPMVFYISGFGLLPGIILLANDGFVRLANSGAKGLTYRHFSFLLMMDDRRRNMLVISFLSVGVFLVLSTGMNRKDLTAHAERPSSGTGGFTFFAETSFPVLHDLNSPEGSFELGIDDLQAEFIQFQAVPGDDASCLNLNRVSRPSLLGFDPNSLDKRQAFTFATKTGELDAEHPWLSLNKPLPNGQIPAIADQTVIKWGLGKSVGDTLVYQNEAGEPVVLKLIGGLANSVFQGNILIGDSLFYANFPSVSGSQVFLIQAPELEEEALRSAFRNYGFELTTTKERLLSFYQIENTYLNIFLMLGALGLLIGTIGLGIVIFRNIFEKQAQYALLEAIGFRKNVIKRMVLRGNLFLVVLSLCIGLIPAVLAALPSLLSSLYAGLLYWSLIICFIVLASAWLWVFIGNRLAMKANLYEALRNE